MGHPQICVGHPAFQWMPGYNGSTNRYTLGGTSYDADGNLLNDSFHSMTWNADGKITMIGSGSCGASTIICLTYDAFGRVVERNDSGTIRQILYTPAGKTAIMNGQTLVRAYIPLPGGAVLFYGSPSQKQIWHKDWLGSVRLGTLIPGRTEVFDRAYAPFGESYLANLQTGADYSFAGLTQDTFTVTPGSPQQPYDTDNRELHPVQGRWLSPDPAGLSAVNLMNPQSWNRYAYVMNNPLGLIDPAGLDCVYLDDSGRSVDKNGIDHDSNQNECWNNGGYWATGYVGGDNSIRTFDNSDNILIASTLGTTWAGNQNGQVMPFSDMFSLNYSAGTLLSNPTPGSNSTLSVSQGNGTPWYKNECILGALGEAGFHIGIDAIGLIPEAGGIARVIGHQAGYVGVVADRVGFKAVDAFGKSTGAVSGFAGLGDTSPEGLVSTSLTVAGFIPGAGQVIAGASVVWDAYRAAKAIGKCE